jgi:hypothetical protein
VLGKRGRSAIGAFVHCAQFGKRRAHHVAADVSTGGDRAQERVVDAADGRLEVALQDAVKLEGLARRQPERIVPVSSCQRVEREPLRGRRDAARDTHPHHELVCGLQLLPRALGAQVAIILLVEAVKLGELRVVLRERASQPIGEALHERAAQVVAALLDALEG